MNWFDEDPEMLRVALEIIESWDGESSVNGVAVTSSPPATEETDSNNDEAGSEAGVEDGRDLLSSSATTDTIVRTVSGAKRPPNSSAIPTRTSTSAAPRELKPSTVSSTRHKRREEILYLRDKVTDMETQLATLHKQKADDARSGTSETNGVDGALVVMWQGIASRQQRLREKAELEQAKLRGLLETQMKVARGLIKLMQKARRIEDDELLPAAKRAKMPIDVSDGISEEELSAHIDELYSRMDEAFSFGKFHDGTLKFIDVEVLDQGDDDVMIEFRDAWALPFEIDEVMDAIWAFMSKPIEQKGTQADALTVDAVSSDSFTTYYSGSATVGALKCTFDGKGISKRFPATGERDAAVITSMFTLPGRGKGAELDSIRVREDGFLRVVSVQTLTGQSDGRVLSVVQSSRRFRLTFDVDKAPASRRNAGVLTDFVLGQITTERQLKLETVETLLLHQRSQ